MLDTKWELAPEMDLTTDTSGYGAYTEAHGLQQHNTKAIPFRTICNFSCHSHHWCGKKIKFHCDNQAVVKAWHSLKGSQQPQPSNPLQKTILWLQRASLIPVLLQMLFPWTDTKVQGVSTKSRRKLYQHPHMADKSL